ncbi:unnamed protein product [Meganyctiphanes norvegica]|uniref:C-type lectin domain-containing protein n=1 Tax=Meganyctiphanes norvegica TaxID=48144 RepID=A0AAV2PJ72_MEGNR
MIAGRCLYISKWGEEKTWYGAHIHCRNLSSQLITDPSWEVASHIRGNKDDCNLANDGLCGFGTWVAGFYQPYESYQWITSTNSSGYPCDTLGRRPITYIDWFNTTYTHNPNRTESDISCLTMITSSKKNGFFADEPCFKFFPYVCGHKEVETCSGPQSFWLKPL